jgi:DNA-binding HxlR family transcriptional regulator
MVILLDSSNPVQLQKHLENFGMKRCPIDKSLKIFGQKYALHIVRNMLLLKQNKIGQFLGSIEGINTKTLSIRLHDLEVFGLIKRTIINSRPVQTEYSLTDKSMALEPILAQIAAFSTRYEPKTIFNDGKARKTVKQISGTERLSDVYDY